MAANPWRDGSRAQGGAFQPGQHLVERAEIGRDVFRRVRERRRWAVDVDRLPHAAIGHEGAGPAVEVAADAAGRLRGVAWQSVVEAEAGAVAEAIGAPG